MTNMVTSVRWWHLWVYPYLLINPLTHLQWCEYGNARDFLSQPRSIQQRVNLVSQILLSLCYTVDRIQFYDVALGLRYLHKVNPTIVHGDLKPVSSGTFGITMTNLVSQSNILVDGQFRAKIYDFGLVNLLHDQSDAVMTTIADSASTTRYLAYELVSSDEEQLPTMASDVYALGCIGLEVYPSTLWFMPFLT